MADVFLLELTHPKVPLQRVMVEANGPVAAKRIYTDIVAKVSKIDAGDAIRYTTDGVPLLRETTPAPATDGEPDTTGASS